MISIAVKYCFSGSVIASNNLQCASDILPCFASSNTRGSKFKTLIEFAIVLLPLPNFFATSSCVRLYDSIKFFIPSAFSNGFKSSL